MPRSHRPGAAILFLLLLGLAMPNPVRAAHEFEKVGTIGAQFLKLPVGARASAMGTAFTSVADDASAVFWNPGGLARLTDRIVAVNHSGLPAGIEFIQGTFVTHFRFLPGTVAFHARSLYMPSDEVRTVFRPMGDGTTFDAGDLALGIVYSRSLTDKFSTGVGVNWIQSVLAGYTAQALTFDFGTLYDVGFRSFKIGMAIQNIGSEMTFVNDPVKVPTIFRVGMSTRLWDRAGQRVLAAGEFSHPPDNAERANAGIEYSFREFFFLRGGWYFRFDTERFAAGAGVRIPATWVKESRFDYAYVERRDLPAVQQVSAEFRF